MFLRWDQGELNCFSPATNHGMTSLGTGAVIFEIPDTLPYHNGIFRESRLSCHPRHTKSSIKFNNDVLNYYRNLLIGKKKNSRQCSSIRYIFFIKFYIDLLPLIHVKKQPIGVDSGRTAGIPGVQKFRTAFAPIKSGISVNTCDHRSPPVHFSGTNSASRSVSRFSIGGYRGSDLSATMLSFRSVLRPSTGALRQLLPSMIRQPLSNVARPFSQLTRLSLGNGLRNLRAGKAQTENVSVASVGSTVRQIEQVRGMKTRSSVKRLCDGCKVWDWTKTSGQVVENVY